MNQYLNSFKPKSRTLLVEDPNVTLPQNSSQNSSYRTHYHQEAFPQENFSHQSHHRKYQHSHNHHLPPHHHKRAPSQGNENRRKTLGGPAVQRHLTIGNPNNPITRTFLQENKGVSNLNATNKMDNVFSDTNLLNKSHHFASDFTPKKHEKPKNYFENGDINQTLHIPVKFNSKTSNSMRNKNSNYFDNNIEGALFGYNTNNNGSIKTNTMNKNTDVANQYEYLQSRQNKRNFSPNLHFNPDLENIHKFNNIFDQKNLTNPVLQNDFNDTKIRKNKNKTLKIFTEPMQKEDDVFLDERKTNENYNLSNHSRSFPAFHLLQQKQPSAPLQPPTILSEASHQPQLSQLQTHQPTQAPTLQKNLLHSSNPHVFNVPITIQPSTETIHLNNQQTFDIANQKPTIPPPRYEDLVEERCPEAMKTFKPTLDQTTKMENNFHSSRSEVQRGRSRLRSDNSETLNKWKNLTINAPVKTDEAVLLVPIGVQNIEGYLPRLTLQGNDTTLQKVRSRSLVRSSTMDRDRTMKNGRQVVNENFFDSMGWYMPAMTRNQAIHYLQNKPVGSFLVRKSSSYSGLYTLVVMVESENNGVKERRVRNFLIEVSPAGAKLRGYENEPEFVNLQALIDFHCQNDINLPCKLVLPKNTSKRNSSVSFEEPPPTLYCGAFPTDGLPDYVALKNSFKICSVNKDKSNFTEVGLQITKEGVVLEKNSERQLFPLKTISHCAVDSQNKSWNSKDLYENIKYILFGFVVQTSNTTRQEVHVLATIPEKATYLTNQLNNAIKF